MDSTLLKEKNENLDFQSLKSKKQKAINDIEHFGFDKKGLLIYTFIGAAIGFTTAILLIIFDDVSSKEWSNSSNLQTLLGAVLGAILYIISTEFIRLTRLRKIRWIEYKLAQQGAEELQDKIEEDFFTKLVQINFKYIDKYYLQTQEQANKSFRLSIAAGIIGLIILIIGILMMFNKPDSLPAAYVTASAGILGEFIAAIFFYLYNQTIMKMSLYHQKLVITQNISLALKISDSLDAEAKCKSLELLIDRLTLDVNKYLTESKD